TWGSTPGAATSLAQAPYFVVVSGTSLYASDDLANVVWRIDVNTGVQTIAAGVPGLGASTGDGAAATLAKLNAPLGLALDGSGNLYIADSSNHRIRKVDTGGTITTVAGTGTSGST